MSAWLGGRIAQENMDRLRREDAELVKRVKGKRCEAVTLVGYRRCRKAAAHPQMHAGRERYVCGTHYESDFFFDSPEYLASPGYRAKATSQTRPGTMTFTTLQTRG